MSANADAATSADVEAKKVNRPSDSRLKQQKLKAWQPILTAGTVLPTFFVIGIIFIPVGAVLLVASNNVIEYVYDYTNCNDTRDGTKMCKDNMSDCHCKIEINITEAISGDVYIYYGLSNFYQNHRRYVKSRDDKQLLGNVAAEPAPECTPFQKDNNGSYIAPCGAIANSMFNDSFELCLVKPGTNVCGDQVTLTKTDIAWPSDKSSKFGNPSNWDDWNKTVKPPNWNVPAQYLSGNNPADRDKNGFKNESFIVWMRLSALPTFRKLHSIVKHLNAGSYYLYVDYNYPVHSFDGKKRFIISTTSWAGGKNPFLGVAYIVVGCLCILTGLIFFFIHLKFGKSLTDMANIGRN